MARTKLGRFFGGYEVSANVAIASDIRTLGLFKGLQRLNNVLFAKFGYGEKVYVDGQLGIDSWSTIIRQLEWIEELGRTKYLVVTPVGVSNIISSAEYLESPDTLAANARVAFDYMVSVAQVTAPSVSHFRLSSDYLKPGSDDDDDEPIVDDEPAPTPTPGKSFPWGPVIGLGLVGVVGLVWLKKRSR